jgi:hypothetical protein
MVNPFEGGEWFTPVTGTELIEFRNALGFDPRAAVAWVMKKPTQSSERQKGAARMTLRPAPLGGKNRLLVDRPLTRS